VLSYQSASGRGGVKHIGSITPTADGKIQVVRADNSEPCFETMSDYIATLRNSEGIISTPLNPPQKEDESLYETSPFRQNNREHN